MTVSGAEIKEKAAALGIQIPEGAGELFELHAAMVMEWNQKLNLTRIPPAEMAEKHFVDSLTLLLLVTPLTSVAGLASLVFPLR